MTFTTVGTATIYEQAQLLADISRKLDVIAGRLGDIATLLTVEPDPPLEPHWGVTTIASTGVSKILGSAAVSVVVVQALPGNGHNVEVGNQSVSQTGGYTLQAGQAVGVAVDNLHQLSVNGTAGDGVCWVGT